METARIVSSPALRFSDYGVNNFTSKLPLRTINSRVPFRARDCSVILRHEFSDSGHIQYYVSPIRSGGNKQKEKSKEMKIEKKKQKLIKRLSKDLDIFSRIAQGEEVGSSMTLADEVKGKMVSEATEVLLAELRQLRLEKKEQKRKRKEERESLNCAEEMVDPASSSSSSGSSSESTDSDCGVVNNMSRFRNRDAKQFMGNKTEQANYKQAATFSVISTPTLETEGNVLLIGEDCRPNCSNARTPLLLKAEENIQTIEHYRPMCSNDGENGSIAVGKKIEICMGGKCKKMGAIALMEEFVKKVGREASVVGCKCMGKCKNGPNVKVSNCSSGQNASVEPPTNPLSLCLGVGLEDVDAIVLNLLRNDNCLMAIS